MNISNVGTMNPLSGFPGMATGTPMYMTGSVIGNGTSNVPQQQQMMMMPQQQQMMMPQQQQMMMPQQQQMMMPQQQQPDLDTYLIALAQQFLSSTGVSDTSNNSQNNNFLGSLGVSGDASNTIPLNDLLLDSDSVDEDSSEESTGFW